MSPHNPTTPRRARNAGRGFSLIELIVVVVIVGIVAAAAAPSFSQAQTTRDRIACRTLARDLAYARERSVATGTRHWIVVNAPTDTYTMFAEDPSNPGRANRVAFTDPATGRSFGEVFGAGEFVGVGIVSVSIGGSGEIGFDWMGRPLDINEVLLTATGTITLSGSQSVTIEAGTGLVRALP